MGTAEDWQKDVISNFRHKDFVTFYNPRRVNWDVNLTQEESTPEFNEQVNWEIHYLEKCDIIFMYLDPRTKSPISLLELGMFANSGKMIVVCPDGFWRKGNVQVICSRFGIPLFETLSSGLGCLRTKILMKENQENRENE